MCVPHFIGTIWVICSYLRNRIVARRRPCLCDLNLGYLHQPLWQTVYKICNGIYQCILQRCKVSSSKSTWAPEGSQWLEHVCIGRGGEWMLVSNQQLSKKYHIKILLFLMWKYHHKANRHMVKLTEKMISWQK